MWKGPTEFGVQSTIPSLNKIGLQV